MSERGRSCIRLPDDVENASSGQDKSQHEPIQNTFFFLFAMCNNPLYLSNFRMESASVHQTTAL